MKYIAILSAAILTAPVFAQDKPTTEAQKPAAEAPKPAAEAPKDTLGYQTTPIIPGSKWHVHDGLRPRP